jgi:hypothetical protein
MATAIIEMDDVLFARIQQEAGDNFAEWVSKACRSRLLADRARDAAVWERAHPVEAARERAEDAARSLDPKLNKRSITRPRKRPDAAAVTRPSRPLRKLPRPSGECALCEQAERRLREREEGD